MKYIVVLTCLAAASAWTQQAVAQKAWPERPVRIVVPFPPGGSSDFAARMLTPHLEKTFKQSFVIENRGGAGGNIGSEVVAKAAPDGYTFLVTAEGPITVSPSLFPKLGFLPSRDLTAVTNVIDYPLVLAVHPSVRAHSVKELIALMREQPGKLSFGHPGMGTTSHLAGEKLQRLTGTDFTLVGYKGGGPSVASAVANETQFVIATSPSVIPFVKAGKLRGLAVSSTKRSALLPDLPTIAEAGVPGFGVDGAVYMMAPAKTPPEILARLHEEVARILKMPEVREHIMSIGAAVPGGAPPAEAAKMIHEETAMWEKLIKALGLKLD
jgi:tripartite-type tricarboxylate transporter receptor subunit TctC